MNDQKLFEALACPTCKTKLEMQEEELICKRCGVAYPIINSIPNVRPEDARQI